MKTITPGRKRALNLSTAAAIVISALTLLAAPATSGMRRAPELDIECDGIAYSSWTGEWTCAENGVAGVAAQERNAIITLESAESPSSWRVSGEVKPGSWDQVGLIFGKNLSGGKWAVLSLSNVDDKIAFGECDNHRLARFEENSEVGNKAFRPRLIEPDQSYELVVEMSMVSGTPVARLLITWSTYTDPPRTIRQELLRVELSASDGWRPAAGWIVWDSAASFSHALFEEVGDGEIFTEDPGETPDISYSLSDRLLENIGLKFPGEIPQQSPRFNVAMESDPVVGEPARLRVAVLRHGRYSDYAGTISFTSDDAGAVLPPPYTFTPDDDGTAEFQVTFSSPGIHRVWAHDESERAWISNAARATTIAPEYTLAWGDFHAHCEGSIDGYMSPDHFYDHARYGALLDWSGISDHAETCTHQQFAEQMQVAQQYYEEGAFVSVPGCEWTSEKYGHNNIYYIPATDEAGDWITPVRYCSDWGDFTSPDLPEKVTELPELVTRLSGGSEEDVLLLRHHPANGTYPTDWRFDYPELQPAVEICSFWGTSEVYGSPSSIFLFTDGYAGRGHYVRDAWSFGYRFGVLGGSDSHDGQAGYDTGYNTYARGGFKNSVQEHTSARMAYGGLTGTYVKSLSQQGLFEAIKGRHTFASSSERRIRMEFSINGAMMGEEITVGAGADLNITAGAYGQDEIEYLQIIQDYDTVVDEVGYAHSMDAELTSTVAAPASGTTRFFVRARQIDTAEAWTSPIWVTVSDGGTPTITPTPTGTPTGPTPTPTMTGTPTETPTITQTPTITPTPTITATPTITPTPTITLSPTVTPTGGRKLAILKREGSSGTNLYYYNSPAEGDFSYWDAATRNPSPFARDLWVIPAGNNATQLAGLRGEGTDLLCVLSEGPEGDANIYLYDGLAGGDWIYWDAAARNPSPLARDFWVIPSGNDLIGIAPADITGDGTDELAVLKNDGAGDLNIYYYNSPAAGDRTYWDAVSRNPSPLARDLWSIPRGNGLLGITSIDVDGGRRELAIIMEEGIGDLNLYIYNNLRAGDWTYWDAAARNPSALARDLWAIPRGNNALCLSAFDADGEGPEELAVLKSDDAGDVNLYCYNAPGPGDWTYWDATARNPSSLARDLWAIPSGNDILAVTGISAVTPPSRVTTFNDVLYDDSAPVYDMDTGDTFDAHALDIYCPTDKIAPGAPSSDLPVLIFVHGGAWTSGEKSTFAELGRTFAGYYGITTVVINYHLSGDNFVNENHPGPVVHPDHVEDCARAFRWVYDNIGNFETAGGATLALGDPGKIILFGHSAGGHLASLLATDEQYLRNESLSADLIRGVISMSGAYDLNAMPKAIFSPTLIEAFGSLDPDTLAAASPATYVDSRQPPFLVLYVEGDLPSFDEQANAFHALLLSEGSDARIRMFTEEEVDVSYLDLNGDGSPVHPHVAECACVNTMAEESDEVPVCPTTTETAEFVAYLGLYQ